MNRCQSIGLILSLAGGLSACGHSDACGINWPPPDAVHVLDDWDPEKTAFGELSLHLSVLNDPPQLGHARPALQMEIASDGFASHFWWVNARMSHATAINGEVEVVVIGADGKRVEDLCRFRRAPLESWEYVVLTPGAAIRRLDDLNCFVYSGQQQVRIHLLYHDRNKYPPSPPLSRVLPFRGTLVSNTVVLDWKK